MKQKYNFMSSGCSSASHHGNEVIKDCRFVGIKEIDERYKELRKQRSVEVETVFGQIKGNQGYKRFLLRGTSKVSNEWELLVLGYNLKQIFRLNKDKTA